MLVLKTIGNDCQHLQSTRRYAHSFESVCTQKWNIQLEACSMDQNRCLFQIPGSRSYLDGNLNTSIFLSKFAKTLFTRSQYCFIDQSSEIWIWNWSKRCHDFKHLTSAKTVDWTADYDKIIVLLKYEINRPLAWSQCGLWQVVITTGYVLQ